MWMSHSRYSAGEPVNLQQTFVSQFHKEGSNLPESFQVRVQANLMSILRVVRATKWAD